MRRHEPIPAMTVEMVPTWTCGVCGDSHGDHDAAYECTATDVVSRVYQCICGEMACLTYTPEDNRIVDVLIPRLARWLRWRDKRVAEMADD